MFKSQIPLLLLVIISGFISVSPFFILETNLLNSGIEPKENRIELILDEQSKQVKVLIDDVFFTAYIFPDSLEKPVLYPIFTAKSAPITRGFPIAPRAGERFDHPHHIGLWFNYGDVNGLDFWNNSSAIPKAEKSKYGHIVHRKIVTLESGNKQGKLEVALDWLNHEDERLLTENTVFTFSGQGNMRQIDRITTLTAAGQSVDFKDNKEGMLGLRVSRELEHPSDKPELFTDASGKITDVPVMNIKGVTGWYRSSEGIEGHKVWGTRGDWVILSGKINTENVSVVIFDHPENPGYPTYWHARGYGLFAANPLGQKALSAGKEELNFRLEKNESVSFRYSVLIYSGQKVGDELVQKAYSDWIKYN